MRVKYKVSHTGKQLPDLIRLSKGSNPKYLVLVFQDMRDYYLMDKWNREQLDKYCTQFKVGIVGFLPSTQEEQGTNESIADLSTNTPAPFTISSTPSISQPQTSLHPLFRSLRSNSSLPGTRSGGPWITFPALQEGLEPLVTVLSGGHESREQERLPIAVYDSGLDDGIRKVLLGGSNGEALSLWFLKLVVLDALHHLSGGQISLPLTRYVMVDIDDIFVGNSRLLESDVQALLDSQERLGRIVRDFRCCIIMHFVSLFNQPS